MGQMTFLNPRRLGCFVGGRLLVYMANYTFQELSHTVTMLRAQTGCFPHNLADFSFLRTGDHSAIPKVSIIYAINEH